MDNDSFANSSSDESIVKAWFGYFAFAPVCLGVPCNLFVLTCAIRLTQCRSIPNQRKSLSPSPSLYHYFILSMASADLIYTCTGASSVLLETYFDLIASDFLCPFVVAVTHASTVASSLSLLYLNVVKFIAIVRPLQHNYLVTKSRVSISILFSVSISVGWGCLFAFGPWTTYEHSCQIYVTSYYSYVAFSALFFIGPISIAGILSWAIFFVVWRANRKRRSTNTETSLNCNRPRHCSNKITYVFLTTAWSCLSCLPYRIFYPIYTNTNPSLICRIFAACCYALLIAHSAVNPIITLCTQQRYRSALIGARDNLSRIYSERKSGKGLARENRSPDKK